MGQGVSSSGQGLRTFAFDSDYYSSDNTTLLLNGLVPVMVVGHLVLISLLFQFFNTIMFILRIQLTLLLMVLSESKKIGRYTRVFRVCLAPRLDIIL